MSDKVIAALIAALVSLAVAVFSYLSNKRTMESKSREIDKQLARQFTEKLYELRLEHYGRAFEITERLEQRKAPDFIVSPEVVRDVLGELMDWRAGQVALIMSSDTLQSFRELREAIGKRPGHGTRYSEEQAAKMLRFVADFRRAMRRDIGFMFDEERRRRNSRS